MFDLDAKAAVDAHPEIRDQGKNEKCDDVATPVIHQQFEIRAQNYDERNPVAEAVLARPDVKELAREDVLGRFTSPLEGLARLPEYFLLRHRPCDRGDDEREDQEREYLKKHQHLK